LSQVLAWSGLVLIASATAGGLMQVAAAATGPPAGAVDQHQATSATVTRRVLIVAVDPVTGEHTQVECDAPAYSFASDIGLIDANDFPPVARVCAGADAPAS
jgi:hypothetical protein